jgi:hypothetical protein
METALDALPGRPLAAEDVAALNNAATVRVIPYTWFGEQVIAALLLHDERPDDEEAVGADARVTDTEAEPEEPEDENPFGTRDDSIGTVEVIEDEAGGGGGPPTERAAEGAEAGDGADDGLSVFAVGYDDSANAWVAICEIDPDAEFTEAEAPIREWVENTYHEVLVDRMAMGPSEYEIDGGQ